MKFLTLILFILALSGCNSLFYYPTSERYFDPAKLKLEYEEHFIKDQNNKNIHLWYFPAKGPSLATVVYFHGNAENLSSHFVNLSWLPSLNISYAIFDYPGYGFSEGEPTPESTVRSGETVLAWIQKYKDSRPLYVFGSSLGGAVGLRAAIEQKGKTKIGGVILDATFSSYKYVGNRALSRHWLTWLLQPLPYLLVSDKWAPDPELLAPVPALVFHGSKDPVVPLECGERLFKELLEPKKWVLVEGGNHGDTFWRDNFKYRAPFVEFINRHK